MKTTLAAVQHVSRSPKLLFSMLGLLFVLIAACWFAWGTVFVLAILALSAFYFQADWAIWTIEKSEPEVVWRIPIKQPIAALTIDDVPHLNNPASFEEILDVLLENKVTATLFIMSGFDAKPEQGGPEAAVRERSRSLLKRAVAEGHELANHMMFDRPAFVMPLAEFESHFLHCDALLKEFAGGEENFMSRPKRWFRPASALWNQGILACARHHGYTTVLANCFPHDVASITRHINATYLGMRARPGSIIIVHDRWHTAQTLRKALPVIAQNKIRLTTLSSLQAAAELEAKALASEACSRSSRAACTLQ